MYDRAIIQDARLSVTVHQIGASHILLLYDLAFRRSHVVVRQNLQADSDVLLLIAFLTQEDHPRVYKRMVPLCVAARKQPAATINNRPTWHES